LQKSSSAGHRFVIVTVSTRKYARKIENQEVNDESGEAAERIILKAGGRVAEKRLISDDAEMLKAEASRFLAGSDDVAVFVGGTGVSHRDLTIEVIQPLFEKELDGFGEALRDKSFGKIRSAALLTRATAGIVRGRLIVCLPGSPDAVATGLRDSIRMFDRVLAEARR
jgi:molybdenum cofactor biosynthesis protein B